MKNKFLNQLKRFSNKFFKTTYLLSYEQQYLQDLHHAITFAKSSDEAFLLNPPAKYELE